MSLLIKAGIPAKAEDAAMPTAGSLETALEQTIKRTTQFYPSVGISGGTIEVELPSPNSGSQKARDWVYSKIKECVATLARYSGASIVSENKQSDAVVFKLSKAVAADAAEKLAQDSAITAMFQPLADAQAELRAGNKKSNVKNVLAAALAAAEKEFKANPFYTSRDKRIIDDAKKVLAQFDAAEAGDADFVNSEEFKKASKIVESIWLLIDRNKNEEAAKLFKDNESFIRKYSHAPNHTIEELKRRALA